MASSIGVKNSVTVRCDEHDEETKPHTTISLRDKGIPMTEWDRARSLKNATEVLAILGSRVCMCGPDESLYLSEAIRFVAQAIDDNRFISYTSRLNSEGFLR